MCARVDFLSDSFQRQFLGRGPEPEEEFTHIDLLERYGEEIREKTGLDTGKLLDGAGGLLRDLFKRGDE